MAVKANEVSQAELLERDVKIQFDEIRRLRAIVDELREENEKLHERLKGEDQVKKDEIAEYIRNQRLARKLSFGGFARLLGTNGTTIQNYEKSKGKLENMQVLVLKIRELKGK
jgi:DNA-binding transcriptional regulator YiaG